MRAKGKDPAGCPGLHVISGKRDEGLILILRQTVGEEGSCYGHWEFGSPFSLWGVGISVLSLSVVSTLCDPMDCSPPDSSVRRIHWARILEWVAMPSLGDLSDSGERMALSETSGTSRLSLVLPEL